MTTKTAAPPAVLRVPNLAVLCGHLTDTQTARVHRTSEDPLRRALAAIPEWRASVEALQRLEELQPPRVGDDEVLALELQATLSDVAEGRTNTTLDELTAQAREQHADAAARRIVQRGHRLAAVAYSERLDRAVTENLDAIHEHLTSEMQAMVARARELGDAFDLTGELAIQAGRVEDYQAAQRILRDWRVFSTIQVRLNAALPGIDADPASPHRWCANIEDPDVQGWPDPRRHYGADERSTAWLRFFLDNPAAVPWFPSAAQMRATTAPAAPPINTRTLGRGVAVTGSGVY